MENSSVTQVSYIVLDFETVTQAGSPPEPIELAAMRIVPPGIIDPAFQFNQLIRPPDHMPHTIMDGRTEYFGADFGVQPSATQVFQQFERYCGSTPFVAVAHNANYDARFIMGNSDACAHVASMPFIDTVKLARHLLPALRSYRLDSLANHFDLPIPLDRHRALPDVKLTCQVLLRLLDLWQHQHQDDRFFLLKKVAGINTQPEPTQPSLFDE